MKKALLGLEFEFFSNLSVEETRLRLEKIAGREVLFFDEGHSKFDVTDTIWKLERDYSGGKYMLEFVTSPLPYDDAISVMRRMFNFIKKYGYTTDKSAFQVNISFDDANVMVKFNKLKFVLEFDENLIYADFPNRIKSIYTKSIKQVTPRNKYYSELDTNINPMNFHIPDSKYYGVNFEKLKKNYLEFRYLGGQDYQTKFAKIKNLIDYFIKSTYSACVYPWSKKNTEALKKEVAKKIKFLNSYKSYEDFIENFKGSIRVSVNLIHQPSHVEIYYNHIKDSLFKLIGEGNLKRGLINYNSDSSKLEIKDGLFEFPYEIKNADLLNCEVLNGNIQECDIFDSNVDTSMVRSCNVYQSSTLTNCKVNDSYISSSSELDDCYIAGGRFSVITGKIKGGIFRSGKITKKLFDSARKSGTRFIEYYIIK